MTHELTTPFLVGLGYLGLLFLLAHACDTRRIPAHWVSHPLTYTLSLGVYATSWSYYGSVGFAFDNGLQYLTIYLGVTLAFALSPVLLAPILRLTRDYQLTSLADLMAFRYRSQAAGALVTLFMLFGTLPYIALQIRAVTESLRILSHEVPSDVIALTFCVTLSLFAMLFGARHLTSREKHRGLVAAIAFESLIKLVVILLIGIVALWQVFDGPSGLDHWLKANPEALQRLYQPVNETPWATLLFLSFGAAFLLPRQFHMLFAENLDIRALRTATWAFPAFLLLLNLPIPVILWAGQYLQLDMHPDYFLLGISLTQGPSWLSVLAFIGGLSAASAMVIVTSLALASMSLNHLLLPLSHPDPEMDLDKWIIWGRRLLIGLIIMGGYVVYITLQHNQGLVQLGLLSFVAVAQFLPGIAGLLYWRRATRAGFIGGLLAGASVWMITLVAPLMYSSGILIVEPPIDDWLAWTGMNKWAFATFASLAANTLVFMTFSVLTRQSSLEHAAAHACCSDTLAPLEGVVAARSTEEFRRGLAETLGPDIAKREVNQALHDLQMNPFEHRSTELRRLRERIERNLSGLLGPQLAHMIVNQRLHMDPLAKTALADSMQYLEARLETSRSQLQGLNAELDNLRRLHRQILHDLPLGVCATDHDGYIVLWNMTLAQMTGISSRVTLGIRLEQLPPPWDGLLQGFAKAPDQHIHRMQIAVSGRPRWFNLHKSLYTEPEYRDETSPQPGMVMIVEDLTDMGNLEAEISHHDRLASLGRLAAGVAHEIGNPVTGIASLAQNLRYVEKEQDITDTARDILQQTQRIADILKTMQSFSRGTKHLTQRETFPLQTIVEEASQLIRLTRKQDQVDIVSHCSMGLQLTASRQQLSQVLVNLFDNAVDASPPGSRIQVSAKRVDDEIIIEVQDQGSGIDPEIRKLVLEPFYTTKPTGEGTGLGLALAHRIIADHRGEIDLISPKQGGTLIRITLPAGDTAV